MTPPQPGLEGNPVGSDRGEPGAHAGSPESPQGNGGQGRSPSAAEPEAPREDGAAGVRQSRRQIVWLMALRVVISTTLLLSALLIQAITETIFLELNPVYYMLGFTYLLTIGYAVIYALVRWSRWFVYTQLIGDLLLVTGLIYYSGGIDSAFPFLYVLVIITASILLMRRGGLLVALAACVLYGSLVAAIYLRVVPPAQGFLTVPGTITMNQVYYNLFVRWIGFVAAALLSSYLAEKLRETGETLEARSADLVQMQVFYEDVINSLNSGLLTTDRMGRIVSLNHAGERILDRRHGGLRGLNVVDVLAPPAELRRPLLVGSGGAGRLEFPVTTPGGTTRHLGVAVSELHDRDGRLRGYTHVFQDLSELKELEREIRLKDRMAAVGEMAAGMAHEVRNPLASMCGAIQVLKAELELVGEQQALMGIVLNESERLNRLIEEFLFYAKPVPILPQPTDVNRLVEETVTLFRQSPELGPGHDLQWSSEVREATVSADPDQIRQVLWNLLRNAAQAMPEGGRVQVEVLPGEAEGIVLGVSDEGRGFAEEEVEQLWQPFHSSSGGSGLGLAIVYRIVRDHGGKVALGNRPTGGARVTVWLPREGAEWYRQGAREAEQEARGVS